MASLLDGRSRGGRRCAAAILRWYSTCAGVAAIPFADGETLGSFPEEGSYTRAGSWVMEVGTSSAHIMIPGR